MMCSVGITLGVLSMTIPTGTISVKFYRELQCRPQSLGAITSNHLFPESHRRGDQSVLHHRQLVLGERAAACHLLPDANLHDRRASQDGGEFVVRGDRRRGGVARHTGRGWCNIVAHSREHPALDQVRVHLVQILCPLHAG